MALDELQALEREYVMGTYARNPVQFVRGEGTRLWDDEGNEYLDFLAGISVTQIGHAHPRLVAAISEQAARLVHVGNLYYTEPGMRLAKRLSDSSLGGKVFFTNSGTEAVECAIKLARRRRQGGDIVSIVDGFHGRTYGSLSATPQETKQAPFAPLVPGFRSVHAAALAETVDERTAAVIVEPIQGESGIHSIPVEMLEDVRAACDKHGALLIFDEIQCGMGRTGSMWAWQQLGVKPDVMTAAKGLGGGLPIGACITTPEQADVLQPGDHGSTFAGGPVPCAAANAVLDVVWDDAFLEAVARKGDRLLTGLQRLGLGGVDGRGLMLGFDAPDAPDLAKRLLLEQRLVVNATGPWRVRLEPPLTVSEEEIDEALDRIGEVLSASAGAPAA